MMEVKRIETPESHNWTKYDENPFCKVHLQEQKPSGEDLKKAIYKRLDEIDETIKEHKVATELLEIEYGSLVEYLRTVPGGSKE